MVHTMGKRALRKDLWVNCHYVCFRVEKEKQGLKSELDDLQSQVEHTAKGKVNITAAPLAWDLSYPEQLMHPPYLSHEIVLFLFLILLHPRERRCGVLNS